jgi:hypothetical protein
MISAEAARNEISVIAVEEDQLLAFIVCRTMTPVQCGSVLPSAMPLIRPRTRTRHIQ